MAKDNLAKAKKQRGERPASGRSESSAMVDFFRDKLIGRGRRARTAGWAVR